MRTRRSWPSGAQATTALVAPEELRASPQATRHDRKRIKELERELLRKDRALAETAALLVLSKKGAGDLQRGRGRMIGLEDRQSLSQEIGVAHAAGARLQMACAIAGIDVRTLQRWRAHAGASQRAMAGRRRCARCLAMP